MGVCVLHYVKCTKHYLAESHIKHLTVCKLLSKPACAEWTTYRYTNTHERTVFAPIYSNILDHRVKDTDTIRNVCFLTFEHELVLIISFLNAMRNLYREHLSKQSTVSAEHSLVAVFTVVISSVLCSDNMQLRLEHKVLVLAKYATGSA